MLATTPSAFSIRLLIAHVLLVASAGCASNGADQTSLNVAKINADQLLSPYVASRIEELTFMSKNQRQDQPPEIQRFTKAVLSNQWDDAARIYGSFKDSWETNALFIPAYDIFWTYTCLQKWDPVILSIYAQDIHASMLEKSVLLTGTDSGRFMIPLFSTAKNGTAPCLISLNALVADSYLVYLNAFLSSPLIMPHPEKVLSVRKQVATRARLIGFSTNADCSAQLAMDANGIIAREIFEANKSSRPFYVDEGYVVEWMYPYLTPAGLLMRLNPHVVTNPSASEIVADFRYWDARQKTLLALPTFSTCPLAQASYAKLRSAIAGIYIYREFYSEAEKALKQALQFYPASPEGNSRLTGLYLLQDRFQEAKQQIDQYRAAGGSKSEVEHLLRSVADNEHLQARQQELEKMKSTGNMPLKEALELADIYRVRRMGRQFEVMLDGLLWTIEMPSNAYDAIAVLCALTDRMSLLAVKSEEAVTREHKPRFALLNLASAYLYVDETRKAIGSLRKGVEMHGVEFIEMIRDDKRFDMLRDNEDFKKLLATQQEKK